MVNWLENVDEKQLTANASVGSDPAREPIELLLSLKKIGFDIVTANEGTNLLGAKVCLHRALFVL